MNGQSTSFDATGPQLLPASSGSFERVAVAFGVAALLARAIPALVQSFWMDEASMVYTLLGGWRALAEHGVERSHVLVYDAFAVAIRSVLGTAEWVLRLPSLIAGLATLFVFARLARRLLGEIGAVVGLLVLLGSPKFFYATTLARPYAFGLLALVFSWHRLLVWQEKRRPRDLVAWALASLAVGFLHLTLLVGLVAQVPLVEAVWRRRDDRLRRHLVVATVGIVMVSLPLLSSLATVGRASGALEQVYASSLDQLALALLPASILIAAIGAFGLALVAHSTSCTSGQRLARNEATAILALWWLPALTAYVVDSLGLAPLFVPRYFLASDLGLALAAGAAACRVSSQIARRGAVSLLAMFVPFTAVTAFWPLYDGLDWRAASKASQHLAQPDLLVIAPSTFLESNVPAYFPELRSLSWLSAPLVVYPLTGRVLPVPEKPLPEAVRFARERLAEERLDERDRFVVLQWHRSSWRRWLEAEYPGFRLARRHAWSRLEWLVYERVAATGPKP